MTASKRPGPVPVKVVSTTGFRYRLRAARLHLHLSEEALAAKWSETMQVSSLSADLIRQLESGEASFPPAGSFRYLTLVSTLHTDSFLQILASPAGEGLVPVSETSLALHAGPSTESSTKDSSLDAVLTNLDKSASVKPEPLSYAERKWRELEAACRSLGLPVPSEARGFYLAGFEAASSRSDSRSESGKAAVVVS